MRYALSAARRKLWVWKLLERRGERSWVCSKGEFVVEEDRGEVDGKQAKGSKSHQRVIVSAFIFYRKVRILVYMNI
jgi:hypothetical protein